MLKGWMDMKNGWKARVLALLERLGLWSPGKVMYIGGSDTLPTPLSREEEGELMERLQQGDQRARQTLIEHNLRLVVYIARRFENTGINIEDLISIGTIGLIKAVGTYQPARSIKLATYASRCIENEILMYLRKNRNSFSDVSLNEPIANEKDGSEITLMDAIAAPEQRSVCEQIVLEERLKQLQAFLPLLDERELMIIEKRFGLHGRKEQTQKEIAQELGISRSYVSRIEKRAFLKLYRAFRRQEKNAVSR